MTKMNDAQIILLVWIEFEHDVESYREYYYLSEFNSMRRCRVLDKLSILQSFHKHVELSFAWLLCFPCSLFLNSVGFRHVDRPTPRSYVEIHVYSLEAGSVGAAKDGDS